MLRGTSRLLALGNLGYDLLTHLHFTRSPGAGGDLRWLDAHGDWRPCRPFAAGRAWRLPETLYTFDFLILKSDSHKEVTP